MRVLFKSNDFKKKTVILFTILLLLGSSQGFTSGKNKIDDTQATTSQSLELTEEEIDHVLGGLKKFNRAILQASQEIPRDSFDPQAVVDNVGEDMKSLLEWVRKEILLVPYQGVLRGPKGVLMDRCGNSLDRALLLQELLRLAGYEVRLAQGELSENKAKEILERIPSGQKNIQVKKLKTDFDNLIQVYALEYAIDSEELRSINARLSEEKDRVAEAIRNRVSEQTNALADLLKMAPRRISKTEKISEAQELRDHWWVQVEENGNWLDLDPTLMDGKPGDTVASMKNYWDSEDLDEDLFHLLTIRVIVERWEEGRLKEDTVLEHDLRPLDLIGERIGLHHDPLNWPKHEELYNNDQPIQNLNDTVSNLEEWIPTLAIGSEKIGKKSFTKSGMINEKPGEKPEQKSGGITGGLMGAFGRSRTKTGDLSILTAEWLEFEIRAPGQPVRKIRREVFDMIGPAKRKSSAVNEPRFSNEQILKRNLLILGKTEILPLACKISPEFVEYLSAREMLSNMEVLISLVEDRNSIGNEDILVQLGLISPLPGPLYNLALSRFALSQFDRYEYLDSLNLFCLQTFLQQNPLGELEDFQKTDIILNDIAVLDGATEDSFHIRMEQGVLETNAEVEHAIEERWTANTALLFANSLIQGIEWMLISDAQDPALQKAQMEPDTRAYIEQDLADGYYVIVPQKPIPTDGKQSTGWWRVDPRSGTTIGMSGTRSGQAMTQYVRSVNMALQLKAAINIHAGILRCMAAAITSPLRGNRPQNDRITLRCIWVTVCSNVQRIAKGLMNIDVNWTNIIISETVNWALKKLCENLWDEVIEK